jgi:hypothetical protein
MDTGTVNSLLQLGLPTEACVAGLFAEIDHPLVAAFCHTRHQFLPFLMAASARLAR